MSADDQKGANAIDFLHSKSIENQKGVIAAQRCSVENQKGTIAVHTPKPLRTIRALMPYTLYTPYPLRTKQALVP